MELIGLYLAACLLLVVAGTAKVISPGGTARALVSMVPLRQETIRIGIRIGSLGEAVLGVAALLFPRTATACLVALSYAVFAAVVAHAWSRDGAIASCGCFGTPDTPATLLHVIVNVGLSVAAGCVAAVGPTGSILSILSEQPLHGLPLMAVSALCAWLIYLAVAVLAALEAARRLTAISFRSES